ncbi:DUF4142 domain-containing protein [Parvularcula dongshanensis]|uniref:Putative membrane protein n=1 Tax=Parvularcula dongshanensis TaxID=1173995 RepID=A0A840I0J2_9PROT|nr:DUF4142 domain-containing protein [Parvularcula dongshanensis]MBB4657793.1 putative membrane protein [Parvularcula dongshanensis]
MKRTTMGFALLAAGSLTAAPALAQQEMSDHGSMHSETTAMSPSMKSKSADTASMDMDAMFTKAAAQSGQFEIQSSQLALDKSDNQDIQQYAQQMITDHQKLSKQLKSAASMTPPMDAGPANDLILASLEGMEGSEFDQAYIENQVHGHAMTVAFFEAMAENGDGELADLAEQALPTLRDHLDHARGIASGMNLM